MQLPKHVRFFLIIIPVFALITLGSLLLPKMLSKRTEEFRAQAEAGKPIVHAIDQFQKDTGSYPASLAELAPKYLPTVPELPDPANQKFAGWDYQMTTNGAAISYRLRYYMGQGGVEYVPPNWVGNDKGYMIKLGQN